MKGCRLVAFACASLALCASAGTFTWRYSAEDGKLVMDGANWEGGVAPTLTSPASAADMDFGSGAGPMSACPRIDMGTASSLNANLYVNSIKGADCFTFRFAPYVKDCYASGRYLTIADPSGFFGWWQGAVPPTAETGSYGPTRAGLCVTAADPAKAVLHRVEADHHTAFIAENSLTIEEGRGSGVFEVNTASHAGRVTFVNSFGPRSDAVVRNGTMVLHGAAAERPGSPTPGAWAQFDASATDSLQLSGSDVVTWSDARGTGLTASGITYNNTHGGKLYYPQIVDAGGAGLKAVNFGAFGIDGSGRTYDPPEELIEKYGQATAMKFSQSAKNVQEVFYVYEENTQTNGICYPNVVGPNFSGHDASGWGAGYTNRIARMRTMNAMFRHVRDEELSINLAEVRVDGQRVKPDFVNDFSKRYHVVSVSLPEGECTAVENISLSRDRTGACSFGGFKLAELLVYTNSLTVAERRRNTDYLMRKWLADDAGVNYDFGRITLASSGARIEVASGTARIRELDLPAGTASFEKTGAGKLRVDRIYVDGVPANVPVVVKEGEFGFADDFAALTAEKAADPDAWFDASNVAAADILQSNGVEYVTTWRDPRGRNAAGDEMTMTRMQLLSGRTSDAPAYPMLRRRLIDGHDFLDLGSYSGGNGHDVKAENGWDWADTGLDSTALMMRRNGVRAKNVSAEKRTREGFIVCRFKDLNAPLLASSCPGTWPFYRAHAALTSIYRPGFMPDTDIDAAYWTVNGKVVDGTANNVLKSGDVYVISFATQDDVVCDALGIDRGQYRFGGIQVAEFITYDRVLTVGERRNTVDYLMRKWLGKAHPDSDFVRSVPSYVVKDAANPVIDADGDVEIGELMASDGEVGGALEKHGTGAAKVRNAFTGNGFTAIDVRDGELELGFSITSVLKRAFFRLDATAAESLTTTGGSYVTTWADADGRKTQGAIRVAKPVTGGKFRPGLSPALRTYQIGASAMPAVDYGPATKEVGTDGYWATESSGHNWFATTGADNTTKYRELYIVCKSSGYYPRTGAGSRPRFFDSYTSTTAFFRNSGNLSIINKDETGFGGQGGLYYGKVWVDDVLTNGSYSAASSIDDEENFHVCAFVPTNIIKYVNAFGNRGGYEAGGLVVGETIAYTGDNSDADRDAIRGYLRRKWLGEGPGYVVSLDRIALAKNARLVVSPDSYLGEIATAELSGSGTVSIGVPVSGVTALDLCNGESEVGTMEVVGDLSLAAVENLTIDWASDMSYDHLSVAGTLELPAFCAVTVRTPRVIRGTREIEILRAGAFVGDASGWTVETPDLARGGVKVSVHDGAVWLVYEPEGGLLIIR